MAVIIIAFGIDLVFSTRTALKLRGDMANSRKWREDLEKLLESLPKPEVIRNLEEKWEQASEDGRQWLEQVKQRLAEYRSAEEEQRKKKQNRLLRAFPNLSQSRVEMTGRLSELRSRLEGWLKEHGKETGDSREDEKKG